MTPAERERYIATMQDDLPGPVTRTSNTLGTGDPVPRKRRRYASVFLDDGNCVAHVMFHDHLSGSFTRDGITRRNVAELVRVITDTGRHVTLFELDARTYHSETTPEGGKP